MKCLLMLVIQHDIERFCFIFICLQGLDINSKFFQSILSRHLKWLIERFCFIFRPWTTRIDYLENNRKNICSHLQENNRLLFPITGIEDQGLICLQGLGIHFKFFQSILSRHLEWLIFVMWHVHQYKYPRPGYANECIIYFSNYCLDWYQSIYQLRD